MKKVNVLGTEYTICTATKNEYPLLDPKILKAFKEADAL